MPRIRLERSAALAGLRKIAPRGEVSASQVRSKHPALYRALIRCFRTFGESRRLAGLSPPPVTRKWSLQRVLQELRRLHREGVRTSVPALKAAGRADLTTAAAKYAGGIERARRLARVPDPETLPRGEEEEWDAGRVIATIRALHNEGEPIAFSRVEGRLRTAARRHCGSYRAAVEGAGFDYDAVRLMSAPFERDDVIDALRRLQRAKPSLTRGQLGRHALARTIGRLFKSIDDALDAAGIHGWPVAERHGGLLSRAAVLRAIKQRDHAGQSLVVHVVNRDDYRLYRSAVWHFEQWPLALRAARIGGHRRVWSRDAVIEALRVRHRRGKTYTAATLKREDNALRLAAERYFGSVRGAARTAGLPSPRPGE